ADRRLSALPDLEQAVTMHPPNARRRRSRRRPMTGDRETKALGRMPRTVGLLLIALLSSSVAWGQPQAATGPTTTSSQPMADLGKGAEEVAAQLRELTESLSDTTALTKLETQVAATTSNTGQRWAEMGAL